MKSKLLSSFVMLTLAWTASMPNVVNAADAPATVPAGVAAVMQAIRGGDGVNSSKVDADPPGQVLAELPTYLNDESDAVRVEAVDIAARVGVKAKHDLAVRRRAMRLLFQVATEHTDASLADYAARRLNRFSRADFTEDMKQTLATYILSRKDAQTINENAVFLAGIANVQVLKDKLREIASPTVTRGIGWSALLALARMGDKLSAEAVIQRVEREPGITERQSLLSDVAFTHQPQAVTVLVHYLFSDETTPFFGDAGGSKIAQRAVDKLSAIIEDFPVQTLGDGTLEDVKIARAWVTETGVNNLRIKQ